MNIKKISYWSFSYLKNFFYTVNLTFLNLFINVQNLLSVKMHLILSLGVYCIEFGETHRQLDVSLLLYDREVWSIKVGVIHKWTRFLRHIVSFLETHFFYQDMLVPVEDLKSSLQKFDDLVQIYPIWLCPFKEIN